VKEEEEKAIYANEGDCTSPRQWSLLDGASIIPAATVSA